MIKRITGDQFGIEFEKREEKDNHICLQLLMEDDGHWYTHGESFSSHWLDDLIDVLQIAKGRMEAMAQKEKDGYGYLFKKEESEINKISEK